MVATRKNATLVGFAAGYPVLAIVGLLLVGFHIRETQQEADRFAEQAEMNAQLIAGAGETAVVFDDADAARQAFRGIVGDPELVYVRIVGDGGVLAEYPRGLAPGTVPALVGGEPLRAGQTLHVSRVVRNLDGEVVGNVQLGVQDKHSRSAEVAVEIGSGLILLLLFCAWIVVHRVAIARFKMREQLIHSERLASLGRLSASVAHEINNPLSFIRSNTSFTRNSLDSIAAGNVELLAEVKEALADTLDGVERVRRIVLDLKSYGRDEAETRVRADLGKIATRAVKMTGNQVRQRATLVVTIAEDLPAVLVDEGRMVQVFVNLLVNASQALPEADPTKHRIELRIFRLGKTVVAEVQDSGTGISDESITRLFEPFYTTKPQGEGMGLGLYLCHSIVRSCGGQISAKNGTRGCTFRIVLPEAAPQTAAELAPVDAPLVLVGARRRVLVVDDEASVVTALRRDLGALHDVTAVSSGASALDLLSRDSGFDVVLCDLMMPGVSGVDVFERAKSMHPGLESRFVFITGGAFTEQARTFLGTVTNRRIDKPLDIRVMHEAIVAIGSVR